LKTNKSRSLAALGMTSSGLLHLTATFVSSLLA
jgi:hypothetical protein